MVKFVHVFENGRESDRTLQSATVRQNVRDNDSELLRNVQRFVALCNVLSHCRTVVSEAATVRDAI